MINRPAIQSSNPSLYTTPVYRGRVPGQPSHNSHISPDIQLIQLSASQVHSLQAEVMPAPHPTPSHPTSGGLCPLRPCSSDSAQSQSQLLATRPSEFGGQGVGLPPPVTTNRLADQPQPQPASSTYYTTPVYRGCAPGGSNHNTSDANLTEPSVRQVATRPVQQVRFEFYSKPMAAKKVILASSAQPWGQKRTTLTQELIRRLLNCSRELSCEKKRKHLDNFMQLLKNSGYSEAFRLEILKSGLHGFNNILKADRDGTRPMYRPKSWKESARWLEKKRKKSNWLGNFWKSCIFVPPTPGSELKKRMQAKEEEMRAGGREAFPIKIIETAGRTLEQTLVNTDPFDGNKCTDEKCEPKKNPKNKISCRRNGVTYRVTCLSCLRARRPCDLSAYLKCACYFGESAKNMHCRSKEHVAKFNSKSEKTRAESPFFKHLVSSHGGKDPEKNFSDYFEVQILKAYRKPFTRLVEEGTFISNHGGELLNSKSEWHQAKIVRTTTKVVQGGAELLRHVVNEGGGQHQGGTGGRGQGGTGRRGQGGSGGGDHPRARRRRGDRARGQ